MHVRARPTHPTLPPFGAPMSVFETRCPHVGKTVHVVHGGPWTVGCLECGEECAGSSCPIASSPGAVVTHRVVRSDRWFDHAPIAGECPSCGARTIHDRIGARFVVCRVCGAARTLG